MDKDPFAGQDPAFVLAKLALMRLCVLRAGVPAEDVWGLPEAERRAFFDGHQDALRAAVERLGLERGLVMWVESAGSDAAPRLREELSALLPKRAAA